MPALEDKVSVWLGEVRAEQQRQGAVLAAILQAVERQRGPRDAADVQLLVGILSAVGDRTFTSGELLTHARVDDALGTVLLDADIEDAHGLGIVLRRMHGTNVHGVRLERVSSDRAGVRWRVVVCGDGEDPSSHHRAGRELTP